ncbi:hypothetical protein [Aeromicrobium sp. 179-A 4D2 NHS]|uniref:hypothetical protein n=1 Tax=Aeromicrobium sp. 179-A 4D2 NHS TaxID=3142375 RepID=UPI0039A2DA2C
MSDKARRKHLTAKGVHASELDRWLDIPNEVADLMLSAGVGLTTWEKFAAHGLTDYWHMRAAVLDGASVLEVRERDAAERKRQAEVEKMLAEETARSLRYSDWDDEPTDNRNEHPYWTPERVAEFRQSPTVTGKQRRARGWLALFKPTSVVPVVSVAAIVAVTFALVMADLWILSLVLPAVGVFLMIHHKEMVEMGVRDDPRITVEDDAREEWESSIRPLVDGGVNPANLGTWMNLSKEVRENAVRNRVGVNDASIIELDLLDHAVTPMLFLRTLDRLNADRDEFIAHMEAKRKPLLDKVRGNVVTSGGRGVLIEREDFGAEYGRCLPCGDTRKGMHTSRHAYDDDDGSWPF